MQDISLKLRGFVESEGESCSMDIGAVTPEYVYGMWGGMPLVLGSRFRVNGYGNAA